ncbi:uncharacterized protein DUF4221 [Algoriphagus ratkowskyi]|uniref:DUF4221 domain-containing protein n=1 Tax=Algoriphagus ratkowskyi TaxID=57028 RepID=A0A2W7QRQ1_9BACT|nr:DUF4221 family protein [Algoriphagus ratkowskyi]PZX51278.1 uncharacterized protein DUF4221 [Algoriphagus ratkowskyi]TXD75931.1 DUF4221 domain-containing protein [Algoriphagus ratkowskyi]
MRLLMAVALFLAVSACASKAEKKHTVSDQIRVSLDTVRVDSGDEFLYLQDHLYYSGLSNDKSYLINFNRQDYTTEKIDLDELRLLEKVQFEKEGPNGVLNVVNYVSHFALLSDGNILFWDYFLYRIFDQNGDLVRDLALDKIAPEFLGTDEYYAGAFFQVENNSDRLIVFIFHQKSESRMILDFDLKDQTFEKLELPELEKLKDFNVKLLFEGSPAGSYGPSASAINVNGQIIISNTAFNEMLIFDLEKDSLHIKSWNTHLLADKKSYVPPKEVERTSGQLKEIIKKTEEDINYRSFFWDEKNERFFRFSEKMHFGEELNGYGHYISTGSDVFLSIFDKEFNLIVEAEISELAKLPVKYFAKDGDIWMYENINDELAFVIMDVEIL